MYVVVLAYVPLALKYNVVPFANDDQFDTALLNPPLAVHDVYHVPDTEVLVDDPTVP